MKTKEEVKHFYRTHLQQEVVSVDLQRKQQQKVFIVRAVAVGLVAAMYYALVIIYGQSNGMDLKAPLLIGTIVLAHVGFYFLKTKKKSTERQIKERVIAPLIHFIDPTFEYKSNEFVAIDDFKASNFYDTKSLKNYTGDDLVKGFIGETEFRFSELTAHRLERSSNNNLREVLIFKGLFFVFDFKKDFDGALFVVPRRSLKQANYASRLNETNATNQEMEKVEMENSHFNQLFDVKATDQILARYVLSLKLMETLIKIK